MRPVRLDMDGFASFRDKTVLDFSDADYFVLVGATGAGKSTVIDAITFALYGTVPRWSDQRVITPALAPTATRGVVRLVFDADGQRYTVAREARRSGGKTSRVSMHASRLERLHNPENLDGEGDVLAADSEVTKAVEDLLGLSYEHFTTCVALPQGEFAEFLHAKPADRQDILSSLLGHQLYDELQKRANTRGREKRAAGDALEATLARYADATHDRVIELTARANRLEQLQNWLNSTGLPGLEQAAQGVTDTADRLSELTAQQQALAAVQVPQEVAALDADLAAAAAALTRAGKVQDAAEAADTQATESVRAFRPRHELITLAQQWHELTAATTDLPVLETQVTDATSTHSKARQATEAAEQRTEQLRAASELATENARQAQGAVTVAEGQAAALAAITIPDDLSELTGALTALRKRQDALTTETDAAEYAYRTAQAAVASAPAEATLSAGARSATTVHDTLAGDLATADTRDQAASALAAAADSLATAQDTLRAARASLDAARLADEVGALRAHLVTGEPCPVCEQPVTTLPREHDASHVAVAQNDLQTAQSRYDQAAEKHAQLDQRYRHMMATRAETLRHVEAARAELYAALASLPASRDEPGDPAKATTSPHILNNPITPDTPATSSLANAADAAAKASHVFRAATESRLELQQAVNAADSRRSNAAAARSSLDRDSVKLTTRTHSAVSALQKARDTVASLGAPDLDTADLNVAWDTLTRWAAAERGRRDAQIPALRDAAGEAATVAGESRTELARAAQDLSQLRERQSTAATELARLAQTRDQMANRLQTLRTALDGQPAAERVALLTADLDNLEQAAAHARETLSLARQERNSARQAVDQLNELARTSRTKLAMMRDPLTRYGAPPIDDDSLGAAWNRLDSWARMKQQALAGDIGTLREARQQADTKYQASVRALSDALIPAGLAPPDPNTPASEIRSSVTRDIATAAASARGDADRAAERLRECEILIAEMNQIAEQAKVATLLANLLRSDAFQAWLLESALTSLVADASELLLDMSSGQFELRARNKDLEVVDHNDADSTRPVRTLSGGETFQASLALALALSRQVSTLAASGAAKLESIFLDEGFGTLDEASLDIVAATLENLASTGERMVGVITHVPALADRIPVRFQVTRTGAKSHIERITA